MRRSDLVVTRWEARFQGRRFRCSIGRGGISRVKREGDGATPEGVFRIVATVYRPDRMSDAGLPRPVVSADYPRVWCDDPEDPNYNTGQYVRWYPKSHERLRRADRLYDIVGVLDYNWPDPVPGAGSAIFLHLWRRPRFPTAGCVAFARRDLEWILARWQRSSRVVIRG